MSNIVTGTYRIGKGLFTEADQFVRDADTLTVLQWAAAINAAGIGAHPESAEYIRGCERELAAGRLRMDEWRGRWVTPEGLAAIDAAGDKLPL